MRGIESAPAAYARAAGALYVGNILFGLFGQIFVRGRLIVQGDAMATAANIVASATLWRWGLATEVLAVVCAVAIAMIYYFLLRPVGKEWNLLATLLRVVSDTVQMVAVMGLVAALFPLWRTDTLASFTPAQLAGLSTLALRWHAFGFGVALLVLGFCFLIHGRLIYRSTFLPKALGILIQIAGLAYLVNGFAMLLSPALEDRIFPFVLLPAFLGETSLCVWLLVKGVDEAKWRALRPSP